MNIAVTTVSPGISCNIPISLFSGTFEERLNKISNACFDGIELLVLDPLELDAEQILSATRSKGLGIAAIGTGIQASIGKLQLIANNPAIENQAFARMCNLIDFAHRCCCPIVTVGSFRGKIEQSDLNSIDRFDRIMGNIADYAMQKSVSIAIEPLNRYENNYLNTASEVVALIHRIGSSNIGLLLDTFHMNIEEHSIKKTVETTARHIIHVHLGDSNRLSPGKGHFDFSSLLATLRSIGYEKWLSAELLAVPDADTAGIETGRYVRNLLNLS